MKQVLLVEDDPMIGQTLALAMTYKGYDLRVARTLSEGSEWIERTPFDLILLDVQLPDGMGFDLCRTIREKDPLIPILMVSARTDEAFAVRALSLGADDYIRKPFGLDELAARMNRLIDRKPARNDYLSFRDLRVDRRERRVWIEGQEIHLGKKEFEILSLLVRRGGEVVTREEILDGLCDQAEMFDRTIDSHLSHLRTKIRKVAGDRVRIQPVYGVGYRIEAWTHPS